jgi:hypothetical protein
MIAARGLQMLYTLLRSTETGAAERYLQAGFKLSDDTIRECATPAASISPKGVADWGHGDWETILKHSTINGNEHATHRLMDHGLVYADYYFVEFANEALKLKKAAAKA